VSGPILVLLCIVVGASIGALVFALASLALTPFARVFAHKVVIGSGPRVFALRRHGVDVELRLFPVVVSLEFFTAHSHVAEEELARQRAALPTGRVAWVEAARWRRVLAFVLLPRVVTLALASLVLGPTRTLAATGRGVVEILHGAWSPLAEGREILTQAATVALREGPRTLVALTLCKLVSYALIALPTDLPFAVTKSLTSGFAKFRAAFMLFGLVLFVAWLIAWGSWMARG
jgi:hypothetical protein